MQGCGASSNSNKSETSSPKVSQENGTVRGTGTIKFISIEGGFYGIVGDDGKNYLANLPPEFKEDGLRVRFEGKIRDEMASIQMWGPIIETTKIEKL